VSTALRFLKTDTRGVEIEMETPDELRHKAARYRQLKRNLTDQQVRATLTTLADECDALASKLEGDAWKTRDIQSC
jgi:hypothetical protein